MVDPVDGQHLPCMWDDCYRPGWTEFQVVVTEPFDVDRRLVVVAAPNMSERWKRVNYLFCTERHKQYWLNSHRSLYNLPSGEKGRLI